jgi:hypothetical protein
MQISKREEKKRKKKKEFERVYLFVAGAFQDMHNPIMTNTIPCMIAVDGASDKTRRSNAARGMADAELICARTVLPKFG